MGQQTYTSGSGTWTVPDGVTSITLLLIGGGGAGAGAGSVGGGGGGGSISRTGHTVTPGEGISYSVGAQGGPLDGGDTTFDGLTAGGGKTAVLFATGGAGGTGDYTGGAGGNGGGGGSSAGRSSNGNAGTTTPGAAVSEGGAGGLRGTPPTAGENPGGGGGGALMTGHPQAKGGAGFIQIDWDDPDEGGGGPTECEVEPFTAEPSSISGYSYDGLTAWSGLTLTSTVAETSAKLVCDTFGLSLHLDAEDQTITGVQIDFQNKEVAYGTVTDHRIELLFGGTPSGGSKAGGSWGATSSYGGPNDLWGLEEISLTDMSQTGSGFYIQGSSSGAAQYSIESVTLTVYTAGGVDNCGNARTLCLGRGTGTAAGKLIQKQVSATGDDGTFAGSYLSDGHVVFGYQGAVP